MRKFVVLLLVLAVGMVSNAQNYETVKESPSLIWAEGSASGSSSADLAALEGLVRMLAATDILPIDASVRLKVWQTYLSDIRRLSETASSPSGAVVRYISWSRVDGIFDSRWQKVRELCDYAEKAFRQGDLPTARTYCDWAETYVASLPPGRDEVRSRLAYLKEAVGEGARARIRLRNVESEIGAIRAALSLPGTGQKDAAQPQDKTVRKTDQPETKSEAPVRKDPERPAFQGIAGGPAIPSGQVEHGTDITDLTRRPASLEDMPSSDSVEKAPGWKISIIATGESGANPAFGLMAMAGRGLFGGYISAGSNFVPSNASYLCSSDGSTDFGYLWATGKSRYCRRSFTAGVTYSPVLPCRLFLGGGYGSAELLWEDTDARWAMVEDLSVRGAAAECGLAWSFGHFTVAAGVRSIAFREASALLGIGWTF